MAKGSCPFFKRAALRGTAPPRISVGTRMRILGGTKMRRLFRRPVYLRVCGQTARIRILVGTRMRILGGHRDAGCAAREIMVRNRALSPYDVPASAPCLSAKQFMVQYRAFSQPVMPASAPRVHTELAPMDTWCRSRRIPRWMCPLVHHEWNAVSGVAHRLWKVARGLLL